MWSLTKSSERPPRLTCFQCSPSTAVDPVSLEAEQICHEYTRIRTCSLFTYTVNSPSSPTAPGGPYGDPTRSARSGRAGPAAERGGTAPVCPGGRVPTDDGHGLRLCHAPTVL